MVRSGRVIPLWTAVLLLAGFTAAAQAQGKAPARPPAAPLDERSVGVSEALRLSGLKPHLAAIRARLISYLDADQTSHDTRQWIAGSLKTVYSPEVYLTPIKQALLDSYDADAITRVLVWHRSPVARKFIRLEEAAQQPGQTAARRKYLGGLEDKQPSDYRLVLIFSIDEASHASAGTAGALKASINGWSLGIDQLGSERERQEMRQIEAAVGKYRAESSDDVADDVLRELMYTYRGATDGDLRAYAAFLESDAGKWFIGTAFKAHRAYFEKATDQIAGDFVNTVTGKQITRPPHPPLSPSRGRGDR